MAVHYVTAALRKLHEDDKDILTFCKQYLVRLVFEQPEVVEDDLLVGALPLQCGHRVLALPVMRPIGGRHEHSLAPGGQVHEVTRRDVQPPQQSAVYLNLEENINSDYNRDNMTIKYLAFGVTMLFCLFVFFVFASNPL